jgi:23S rRNA (pseudouridine1915-N3)-methyltransferase
MQLHILATGTTRDSHLLALESQYHTRMPQGWPVHLREVRDGLTPDMEAAHQLAAWQGLPAPKALVVLDEKGRSLDSGKLAGQLQEWGNRGLRTVAFLIGGDQGLADRVRAEATLVLSLSPLTFPHQLVRVILAEQLYRAGTIMAGHPYHRE